MPSLAPGSLVFLKLGGSLITDKNREAIPRPALLARLATEVSSALESQPDLPLIVGHGSGSYGHFAGRRFGTRHGIHDREGWVGYAHVAAAAARLNRLVVDTFLAAHVPVLGLQPSASARCHNGVLTSLALGPIRTALAQKLVPLVYGDVALDDVLGGTIISTEELFIFLAGVLHPSRILLAGEFEGVIDDGGVVIPALRPEDRTWIENKLRGSHGVDVTGGMLSKVTAMLHLVAAQPGLQVRIFSGVRDGELARVLLDPGYPAGTLLSQ